MSFEFELRDDLLTPEMLADNHQIKIVVQREFQRVVEAATKLPATATPRPSKNIVEVMELIRQAFIDYETRTHVNEQSKIHVTYEKPDVGMQLETVSICLKSREPGQFAQGKAMGGGPRNMHPILRETLDDPDNPGYKRAVFGYFYDNILELTPWARTADRANKRALWVEDVMEEYAWFFGFSGVNRLLYYGRGDEDVKNIDGNKIYGRPIRYFVRTEKIRNVSQKTLELIYIRLGTLINEINT